MKYYRILGKRGRMTIPYELRMDAGIHCNDLISIEHQKDGSIRIQKEMVCNHCADEPNLCDTLDRLSREEKQALLVRLSLALAQEDK